jgi:hypothetical protein
MKERDSCNLSNINFLPKENSKKLLYDFSNYCLRHVRSMV